MVKNVKLGKEICIELKIDWVETKRGVRQIITIVCVTYAQNNFWIRTLMKQLLTKLPQISHFQNNHIF